MPTVIDELLVRLGFHVESEKLHSFAENLDHVKDMAEAVFSFEIIKRVGEFVESSIEASAHTYKMAEAFDLSATKMAAMQRVAVEHGASAESIIEAYTGISQMAGQAALGIGRGARMFQQLGLHAKDATGKAQSGLAVMGDVADKLAKLSTTERLGIAGRLGIDPVLAKKMAEMGRKEFMAEVAKAEGKSILSEHDYKVAEETEIAFGKLKKTVSSFVTLVAIQLGPTVQKATKAFTDWVATNRQIIVQRTREYFEKIREILSKVVDVVKMVAEHGTALKVVLGLIIANKLGATVTGWLGPLAHLAGNLKTGAGAAEALKAGFAGIKTVITGGVLAALGLVIEDLWTFYQGGDSVTGWMMNKFPGGVAVMHEALVGLGVLLTAMLTGSGPIGALALMLGALLGLFLAMKDPSSAWAKSLAQQVDWLNEKLDRFENAIRRLLNMDPLRKPNVGKEGDTDVGVPAAWRGIPMKDVGKFLPEGWDRIPAGIRESWPTAPAYSGNMLTWGPGIAAAGAAAGGGSVTVNAPIGPTTINVNGAQEPAKVAAEVIRQQERRQQLARQATRDAQTGHR